MSADRPDSSAFGGMDIVEHLESREVYKHCRLHRLNRRFARVCSAIRCSEAADIDESFSPSEVHVQVDIDATSCSFTRPLFLRLKHSELLVLLVRLRLCGALERVRSLSGVVSADQPAAVSAACRLAFALSAHGQLQHANLKASGGNDAQRAAAEEQLLAAMAGGGAPLQRLRLSREPADWGLLGSFAGSLRALVVLGGVLTGRGLPSVAPLLGRLRYLRVGGVRPPFLEAACGIAPLETLVFEASSDAAGAMGGLPRLRSLKKLTARLACVGGGGPGFLRAAAAAVAGAPSLEELRLTVCLESAADAEAAAALVRAAAGRGALHWESEGPFGPELAAALAAARPEGVNLLWPLEPEGPSAAESALAACAPLRPLAGVINAGLGFVARFEVFDPVAESCAKYGVDFDCDSARFKRL